MPVHSFRIGDTVQTPFGKGRVRELRNNGRLLIDVGSRAMEFGASDVTAAASRPARGRASQPDTGEIAAPAGTSIEIDLHGQTVAEAIATVERSLNDALLGDVSELRLIHGRSGGRIRAALHRRLKEIPSVRAFAIDPNNQGVTIVRL